MVFSQGSGATSEGYIIKAGDIAPQGFIEGTQYISFASPFPNHCYGVVITQHLEFQHDAWNVAVVSFNKNGFTYFSGGREKEGGFSYLAFGD